MKLIVHNQNNINIRTAQCNLLLFTNIILVDNFHSLVVNFLLMSIIFLKFILSCFLQIWLRSGIVRPQSDGNGRFIHVFQQSGTSNQLDQTIGMYTTIYVHWILYFK